MATTEDEEYQYDELVEELIANGANADVEVLFQEDVANEELNLHSELRRVSNFNVRSLQQGDLLSIVNIGAYVESSCLDAWSVIANKWLSKQADTLGVVILTQPTSQAIFQLESSSEILNDLAIKWKSFVSSPVRYLLLPVNLKNKHWCLLVVDLQEKSVVCWDSLYPFDNARFVNSKKTQLALFLDHLTGEKWKFKNINLDYELPQQTNPDCGIFCIEFMRAFITGCTSSKEMSKHVSNGTIVAARQHIAKEIVEREILAKHEPVQAEPVKRVKKKSRKALEHAE